MAAITLPDNWANNLLPEELLAVAIGAQSQINDKSAVSLLWGMRPPYVYPSTEGYLTSTDYGTAWEPASSEDFARQECYDSLHKLCDDVATHAGYNSYYASTPENRRGRIIYLCAVKYAVMKMRAFGKPEKDRLGKPRKPRAKMATETAVFAVPETNEVWEAEIC